VQYTKLQKRISWREGRGLGRWLVTDDAKVRERSLGHQRVGREVFIETAHCENIYRVIKKELVVQGDIEVGLNNGKDHSGKDPRKSCLSPSGKSCGEGLGLKFPLNMSMVVRAEKILHIFVKRQKNQPAWGSHAR